VRGKTPECSAGSTARKSAATEGRAAVAKKLEDLLQPEERVVFRSRYSVLAAIGWMSVPFLPVWIFAMLANRYISKDHNQTFELLIFLILVAVLVRMVRNYTVILTDRRLLYRYGSLRRKIIEIPFNDIHRIECTQIFRFGPIKQLPAAEIILKRYSVPTTRLNHLPNQKELAQAIAAQAGVPALKV
jgi:hypothetical protein